MDVKNYTDKARKFGYAFLGMVLLIIWLLSTSCEKEEVEINPFIGTWFTEEFHYHEGQIINYGRTFNTDMTGENELFIDGIFTPKRGWAYSYTDTLLFVSDSSDNGLTQPDWYVYEVMGDVLILSGQVYTKVENYNKTIPK